eukprot:11174147-Lingulodinium_polyedra.AAC.1
MVSEKSDKLDISGFQPLHGVRKAGKSDKLEIAVFPPPHGVGEIGTVGEIGKSTIQSNTIQYDRMQSNTI